MKLPFISVCTLIYFLLSCQSPNREMPDSNSARVGNIEWYDSSARSLIDSGAAIEIIGKGYDWCEGPLWVKNKNVLLFSDVAQKKVYAWREGDTPRVALDWVKCDTALLGAQDGSNGLALDAGGRLLVCLSGKRQVVRMNNAADSLQCGYTILSAGFNGKKYNSPNDLVADKKNNIYFTDPVYGLKKQENDPAREMDFEGVFRIGADGKTTLLIDSIPRPNGIALSDDEKTLYVASSDQVKPRWYAYGLSAEGTITGGGTLLDAVPFAASASVKQYPDGFKIDRHGNIFSAGPDGVNIVSPQGRRLGLIRVYNRKTSNCAFNEEKNVLYVTADDVVLRVRVH